MTASRNTFCIVGAICAVVLGVPPWALGQLIDCNGNGVPDDDDTAEGTSQDCDENGIPDECEVVFIEQIITTTANGAWSVFAADLDGDGDIDVLSASQDDDTVAWYENTDGLGSLGPEQIIISTAANGARSVFAADLDGDGDIDVLSASALDDTIAWYENTDGLGSFGPQQIVTTAVIGAQSVFAADLDGDGDIEVLSASLDDDKIAWYATFNESDCNGNEIPDVCDIAGGTSDDCDGNGIPDECDLDVRCTCEGDANGDGSVDPLDVGFVLSRFGCEVGAGDPNCDAADANADGAVDPLDIGFILSRFGECP